MQKPSAPPVRKEEPIESLESEAIEMVQQPQEE